MRQGDRERWGGGRGTDRDETGRQREVRGGGEVQTEMRQGDRER